VYTFHDSSVIFLTWVISSYIFIWSLIFSGTFTKIVIQLFAKWTAFMVPVCPMLNFCTKSSVPAVSYKGILNTLVGHCPLLSKYHQWEIKGNCKSAESYESWF
jgi:hypothetical protein